MSTFKGAANDALARLLNGNSSDDNEFDALNTVIVESQVDLVEAHETFEKRKAIVLDKGHHKDWQQRELALTAMQECFENVPPPIVAENQDFLVTCTQILKNCLEENNI